VSGPQDKAAYSAELKALVGIDATWTPEPAEVRTTHSNAVPEPVRAAPAVSEGSRAGVVEEDPPMEPSARPGEAIESLLAMTSSPPLPRLPSTPEPEPNAAPPPARAVANPYGLETGSVRPVKPAIDFESDEIPQPAPARPPLAKTVDPPKRGRVDLVLLMLLLVVLGVGAFLVWSLRPGFFTGRTPEKIAEEKRAAAAAAASATALSMQQTARCKGALAVGDVPTGAEVLLRVGSAPVDVERMPMGARLEFVATAEGYAPRRTVVPAGATWDTGNDGKPRFEVAVQLDKARAKPVEGWPPAEPGSVVGGDGKPGTVHIVSSPPKAEVWLLVGLGPEAKIDHLKCDEDVDVLVAGPTTFRKRLHVGSQELSAAKDGLVRISAK
jgi:hypothetical protein